MAHVAFISYSSKDKAAADAVCRELEGSGIKCWYAPRDIRAGTDWSVAILDAIAESQVMVLIFSSNANLSADVILEVKHAFRKGRHLVPFRIEKVEPTKTLEYYLAFVHWLDAWTPPLEDHLSRLTEHIRAFLPQDTPTPNPNEDETSGNYLTTEQYQWREYLSELVVLPDSKIIGKTLSEVFINNKYGLAVIGILRGDAPRIRPNADEKIEADDVLLVQGPIEDLLRVEPESGIEIKADFELSDRIPDKEDSELFEAMLLRGSDFIGRTIRGLKVLERYHFVVLGLSRHGVSLLSQISSISLRFGDVLLIRSKYEHVEVLVNNGDLLLMTRGVKRAVKVKEGKLSENVEHSKNEVSSKRIKGQSASVSDIENRQSSASRFKSLIQKWYWSRGIVLFVILIAVSGAVYYVNARYSRVNGVVSDWQGNPVAGAYVKLTSIKSEKYQMTQTDSQGNYSFSYIDPGTYSIEAYRSAYSTQGSTSTTNSSPDPYPTRLYIIGGETKKIDLKIKRQTLGFLLDAPLFRDERFMYVYGGHRAFGGGDDG
jgi:uncharacterized protein with PhoU and TrkA domain